MQGPRGVWGKSQLISQAEIKAEADTGARIKAQRCQQGDNAFAVLLCTRACYAAPSSAGKGRFSFKQQIQNQIQLYSFPSLFGMTKGEAVEHEAELPVF